MDKPMSIGSLWQHRNGIEYKVIAIANQYANAENQARYPVTVIYQGQNGKIWARELSDWSRSFTEVRYV